MSDKHSASLLTLDIQRTGNVAAVRCRGKLVAGVSEIFYDEIREIVPQTKRIVLDLTDLTRMDSLGLGALVRLYVSGRSSGCSLELINLGKQVRDLLGMTNLLNAFTFLGERGMKTV
jgi:anti-sigma B factor antagonist